MSELSPKGKNRLTVAAVLIAIVVAVTLALVLTRGNDEPDNPGQGRTDAATATADQSPSGTRASSPSGTAPAVSVPPGMATVRVGQLPPEAQQTLRLIDAGGPFPYRQDGAVFANREGRLPAQKSGYYREYTVDTPGSADRGARRVITGSAGERYYTPDHYATFQVIIP